MNNVEPGAGAVEFATELVTGMPREKAALVLKKLLASLPDDKRVKSCGYCQYPFRDDSLRNRKQTCCQQCKTGVKTMQRRQQRADKLLLAGIVPKKKKAKLADNYASGLEYPFWSSEYAMLQLSWKYECPLDIEKIDFIHGQRLIYGEGNRKKRTQEEDDA
ncbi:hypothetical protein [Paenibacillus sp. Leaf72]|uniref:hypothetical protein n=1 Tax=Paenibacillus sp. Leaf72 TaxID=1736234 RepID=UPI0006F54EB9|nr:hypothetical protein [Paenibacillus sp. Leaf72]KQN97594.1 hypothetical protein ASF12_20490 [Paenibacillus sp. Leaf72]